MLIRIITFSLLFIGVQSCVPAQVKNSCASFQQTVESTYNFKPSQLKDAERSTKSSAMDRFWEMVKADPNGKLPCLRLALQDTKSDKWFRFDASSLLVEIDPSTESKVLQVQCFTDADLEDVDLRTWVQTLSVRGYEGFDVSEAASNWLSHPKAKYYLPEHGAYEVNSFQGALFMFGSMDEALATAALIKLLSQPNHPGHQLALVLLLSQATEESLKALKRYSDSNLKGNDKVKIQQFLNNPNLLKPRAKPQTNREEFIQSFQSLLDGDSSKFMELVSKVPDGEKDVIAVMKPEDLPLIRKVRRRFIANGNQHSIEYYKSFTSILMALVWKPELVK